MMMADKENEEWEELDEMFLKYAKKLYTEALNAVWDLDPEGEDYYAQVAEIWARKDLNLWRHARKLMARHHKDKGEDTPPETLEAAEGHVFPALVADPKGVHFVNGNKRFSLCGEN